METALYFPYIRVPETSWFTQILLYWDRAATIIPRSIEEGSEDLSPYMVDLQNAEMLEYVYPSRDLWQHQDAFNENFIALIRDSPRQLTSSERPTRYTDIHVDKIGYSLVVELHKMGYAKRCRPMAMVEHGGKYRQSIHGLSCKRYKGLRQ